MSDTKDIMDRKEAEGRARELRRLLKAMNALYDKYHITDRKVWHKLVGMFCDRKAKLMMQEARRTMRNIKIRERSIRKLGKLLGYRPTATEITRSRACRSTWGDSNAGRRQAIHR